MVVVFWLLALVYVADCLRLVDGLNWFVGCLCTLICGFVCGGCGVFGAWVWMLRG